MKFRWIKNKFVIAGALVLVVAAILVFSLSTPPTDKSKVKGTIASYYPAIGDNGHVRFISNPGNVKVHFEKDPIVDRLFNCVKSDDNNPVAMDGKVRCISATNVIIVTNE
jgi:hypothetical protein